jgi:hypothetical protein
MSYRIKLYKTFNGYISNNEGQGEDVTNYVVNGFSFLEKLDESLDIGTMVLRNRNEAEPFSMFDIIEVETVDEQQNSEVIMSMRIGGDEVQLLSKDPKKYEHTLSLVEHTKLLERYVVSGKTFTQPTYPVWNTNESYDLFDIVIYGTKLFKSAKNNNEDEPDEEIIPDPSWVLYTDQRLYTLLDVLDILRKTTPLIEMTQDYENYPYELPVVGSSLYNLLSTTLSPEFTFKDLTLKEILMEVFGVLDAIPRLTFQITNPVNGSFKKYLTADFVNELKELIIGESQFSNVMQRQDLDNYLTNAESEVLNAVNDQDFNESVEIVPSPNGWISWTQDDYIQGDYLGAYISTPKPISSITKVYSWLPARVYRKSDNALIVSGGFYRDITDFVVEKKIWDTLDIDITEGVNTPKKNNSLYYNYRKENIIIPKEMYDLFGDTSTIEYLIKSSLYKTYDSDLYSISPGSSDGTPSLLKTVFQIHYVPLYRSERYDIERQDITFIDKKTTQVLNQQSRLVDLSNYMNRLQNKINRIGNNELVLEGRENSYEDGYNVGDYTDDLFIITQKESIIFKDYIFFKYQLTKNFNMISKFIGVDSEIRQYEMGEQNTLDRNLVYKEYIQLDALTSFDYNLNRRNSSVLNNYGCDTIIETFDTSSSKKQVQTTTVYNNGDGGYVLAPTSTNGAGNNLILNLGFNDNKVAGEAKVEENNRTVKEFIPYTDAYGVADYMVFRFYEGLEYHITGNDFEDLEDLYDLSAIYPRYTGLTPENNSGTFQTYLYKDNREILSLTLSYQFLTKDISKIGFGRALSSRNRYVNGLPPQKLYVKTYNDFNFGRLDTKKAPSNPVTTDEAVLTMETDSNYFVVENNSIIGKDSYCITDEYDNILIWVNQNGITYDTIVFDFQNQREGINYNY